MSRKIRKQKSSLEAALFKPIALLSVLPIVLLLAVTIVAGIFLSQSVTTLENLTANVNKISRLQRNLFSSLSNRQTLREDELNTLRESANELIRMSDLNAPETALLAEQAKELLGAADKLHRQTGERAIDTLLAALAWETEQAGDRLRAVYRKSLIQLWLVAGAFLCLLAIVIAMIINMRVTLIRPLQRLTDLMGRMARQDFSAQAMDDVPPQLAPVFSSYNHLVNRLHQYELLHRQREAALTEDVRAAVKTLLQQQTSVARAERLAAVGELAAGLSHEIRNPLSSIRAASRSLLADMNNPDYEERLTAILRDVDQVINLANAHLKQAHHKPEKTRIVDIGESIAKLGRLFKHQLGDNVKLHVDIDACRDIELRLPEAGFRQALLNLLTNAQQAIGDEPGEIILTAKCEDDVIRIAVEDTGPGFDPALVEQGIQGFVTAHRDGTGLGLAAARRFVEAMQGRLTIANRDPAGARVQMTLPVRQ